MCGCISLYVWKPFPGMQHAWCFPCGKTAHISVLQCGSSVCTETRKLRSSIPLFDCNGPQSSYSIIMFNHHVQSSYSIIIFHNHIQSSYSIIIINHYIQSPYSVIIFNPCFTCLPFHPSFCLQFSCLCCMPLPSLSSPTRHPSSFPCPSLSPPPTPIACQSWVPGRRAVSRWRAPDGTGAVLTWHLQDWAGWGWA